MRIASVLFVLASLFFVSDALAAVTIGNGFTCDGTTIKKGAKVVKFSKAKSTLAETIEKLKEKLGDAPKKKKGAIKAQLAAAKTSKILLISCSKGTLAPNQVDPVFTKLAAGSGVYSGTYNGTVQVPLFGTQPISGDIAVAFKLTGTVFGAVLTLGGQLGNTLNAKPLAFESDVGGVGFPAQFTLQGTFLGTVTLTVSQAGHLSITNSDQSKPANFEGDFQDKTITATLSGSYSGIPYSGNVNLVRQD